MLDRSTRPRPGASPSASGRSDRASRAGTPSTSSTSKRTLGSAKAGTSTKGVTSSGAVASNAARATRVAGRGLASSRSRFERRAAAARRRPRLLAGIGAGLLLLVGALVWVGWFSSLLTVTTVQVRGASGQAAAQVLKA
ncbi:MAG: Polypeptide-transport-associated domain protein FtsQ-type, partial [Humibacillus sp.]|nr:Polypeptide-transport-associated domain protein FtsQ-type [Humibacillus sp.]